VEVDADSSTLDFRINDMKILLAIEGTPKSVILEEAEIFGADLIVVGSHGCGVVERFLLGSVSHEVSLHAKCSVLIVRK